MEEKLPKLKLFSKRKGVLWITYPKGTSGVKTDLNRDKIRDYVSTQGLQAVSLISIDNTWSALRVKLI